MIDFSFAIEDKGEYDYNTMRGYVNPARATDLNDLYDTIRHETLHQIISENFGTTEKQDHFIIEKLGFIDEWINL